MWSIPRKDETKKAKMNDTFKCLEKQTNLKNIKIDDLVCGILCALSSQRYFFNLWSLAILIMWHCCMANYTWKWLWSKWKYDRITHWYLRKPDIQTKQLTHQTRPDRQAKRASKKVRAKNESDLRNLRRKICNLAKAWRISLIAKHKQHVLVELRRKR